MKSLCKKAVALLLCIVSVGMLMLPLMTLRVSAAKDGYLDPSKPYPMFYKNIITYTCQYDEKTSKILVNGTVPPEVVIQYKEYFLDVYVISPGQSVQDAVFSASAKKKASMNLAIKFDFSLSASTMNERFSRYAIVIRSPEGQKILASEPQYIYVASSYQHDPSSRLPYKGISSAEIALSSNLGAGTAIVPVYFNQLLGTNSGGMIYPMEEGFCYFNRAYVEALDAKVRSYSASGTRVYFQLLLEANGSEFALANGQAQGAIYDFPNLQDSNHLQKIAAAANFLAERYETNQSGLLSGIIVGSSIDKASQSYTGGLPLDQYAERYAFYLMVVASSVRIHRSEIDVILPFSSMDTYSDPTNTVGGQDYSPSALLEAILSILDERLSKSFSCGTMIESNVLPIKSLPNGESPENSTPSGQLHADNLGTYETYLSQLSQKFLCAPDHFIYRWQVPTDLSGTRLNCAYAYSYYRLLHYARLSSFVLSLSHESQQTALNDLARVFRDIDTEKGPNTTAPLLSHFGVTSWNKLLSTDAFLSPAVRKIYRIRANTAVPAVFKGSFEYFDFSSGSVGDWFAGIDCQKVRTDFLTDGVRGVRGTMLKSDTGTMSEMLCLYEFSENFIYTPYLKLTLELTDATSRNDALFEITVSMGNDTTTVLCEQTARSGERCEIWLDLTSVSKEELMTNYIRIGAAMIDGSAEKFSVGVVGLTGYSEEYDSEELANLIEAERLRIRNQNAEDEEDRGQTKLLWIIFGGLLVISAVILGVALFVKKNDEEEATAQKNEKDQFLN